MTRPKNGPVTPGKRYGMPRTWRQAFLTTLAETSNVTAAAEKAGISLSGVYKTRKDDPAFARAWEIALCAGYDSLEMEVLSRLRSGDAESGKKFDNAAAIRLLGLHRANAARARALRENEDEQAVLDSIDAMIDEMRNRAAANAAIIAEDDTAESADEGA